MLFVSALLSTFGIAGADSAAGAGCDNLYVMCTVDTGGIETGLSETDLDRANKGRDVKTGAVEAKRFEYSTVYACQFNVPGPRARSDADVMCMGAIAGCAGNTPAQGQGPMARLYRRELNTSGNPAGGWVSIGTTCFPEVAPGNPVLGMGQILEAFNTTPWATPTTHIQPEGNTTLVTLDTYFQATWPAAGYQPGEINTITLLGTPIRIRPTARSYTYHFGDGTTLGPTDSPGGPYPDGNITHAYPTAGTYTTRIDITYGGEFSINGGPWLTIPNTATVTGTPQTLTVKTAHARLVTH